ncbi:MAG: TIGR02147 family protein [Oligoflexia bacterium]|nr:TIGR02147 family protein [Oligoflexia bacterium]
MTTTKSSLFEFTNYKHYLVEIAGGKKIRRGIKAKLARAAGCQATYLSQVLHGKAHLSPEQGERLSRYLRHSKDESQFFMLLLHKGRAGTTELTDFYSSQLEDLLAKRMNVVHRLGARNSLNPHQQAVYYSSWQFAAIHIALTVPELQKREAISEYFRIPLSRVDHVLDFLTEAGLARPTSHGFSPGETLIRLGRDSPQIFQHHAHWRQQAIESLESEDMHDLHYSAVVSLSRGDATKVKDLILQSIKSYLSVIQESKEEEVYAFTSDFFSLKKTIASA